MERRLLLWFVTSTAFLLVYMALNFLFVPPPVQKPAVKPADAAIEAAPDADVPEIAADRPVDPEEPQAAGADAEEEPVVVAPARMTLGSMDAASGYFILATLNNRGGTIERVELTERDENGRLKYHRVDTTSGYLGYLAPEPSPQSDGCLVRVVGPGTPAAVAKSQEVGVPPGLQPGDLIVAVNGNAISGPSELDRWLSTTKPDEEITIEILRPTAAGNLDAAANQGAADQDAAKQGEAKGDVPARPLKFTTTLTEHPLDLIRLASTGGDDEIHGNLSRLACRLTLSQIGNKSILTGESSIAGLEWLSEAHYQHDFKADDETQAITFTLPLTSKQLAGTAAGPLTITRSYALAPRTYLVGMNVALQNTGDKPQKLAYRLEGPTGVTLEGWWYSTKISPNFFGGAAARDVIYKSEREGHVLVSGYDLLKKAKNSPRDPNVTIFALDEEEQARSLRYIGIDAQYFNVAYVPPAEVPVLTGFRQAAATLVAEASEVPRHKERAADVSFFLDSLAADVPPNGELREPLRMYMGPKVPELLEPFGLDDTIEYGWFGRVSKFLAWVLHGLYDAIGNYAIAIVMLTIIVRALLFPVSRNAAIHAQRMQELAPELKKINDKYKDDMEAKLRAQREFQKRVGFNPLAGCLPALLQLPIFIGLYRALSVDIELRQAALAPTWQWASNLAGPDMLYYWRDWLPEFFSGRGTGWLGPYFNILPIIVVILFLIQQKMFMPPPTDEQQAITQKVMTVMTLMMALFFFRVPAGLCIYFITSSLWGIAERIIVKKTIPPSKLALAGGDAVVDGTVTSRGTVTSNGTVKKNSIADRIRQQINPEPPKALPPAKRKKPPGRK